MDVGLYCRRMQERGANMMWAFSFAAVSQRGRQKTKRSEMKTKGRKKFPTITKSETQWPKVSNFSKIPLVLILIDECRINNPKDNVGEYNLQKCLTPKVARLDRWNESVNPRLSAVVLVYFEIRKGPKTWATEICHNYQKWNDGLQKFETTNQINATKFIWTVKVVDETKPTGSTVHKNPNRAQAQYECQTKRTLSPNPNRAQDDNTLTTMNPKWP